MRRVDVWLAAALVASVMALLGPGELDALADEPRGTWRFQDEARPVKAVVVGGSISAWQHGSFAQYLSAVCRRVEIVNKAKSRLGAAALYDRFDRQVIDNRRLDLAAHEATWLIWFGGLNSVSSPELTNERTAAAFEAAHAHGMGVLAFSLGPWGSERDRRWAGAAGLEYLDHTQRAVDFVLGRSTPQEAFGRFAGEREGGFQASERPDVAIDLWDSPLRHVDAPLRARPEVLRRQVQRDPWTRKRLATLPEEARPAALEAFVQRALELPRWFMAPEYIGFDAIHPNAAGHLVIARTACPSLPESWGCECGALATASWDRKRREVVLDDEANAVPTK